MKRIVFLTALLFASCGKKDATEIEVFSKQKYDYVNLSKDGERTTLKDNKQGLINAENKIILPTEYDYVNVITNMIVYRKGKEMGILAEDGSPITKKSYRYIFPVDEDLFIYKDKNKEKFGLIDRDEKVLFAPKYDFINSYIDGVAVVRENGLYGIIDSTGKELSSPKYLHIKNFSNGMAMVVGNNKKAGFINLNGEEVVIPNLDYTEDYTGESTFVYHEEKFGVMNKSGKFTIPLRKERINPLGQDFYSLKIDNSFYLVNMDGKYISKQPYDNMGEIEEDLIPVSKDGKFGYINLNGQVIIPLIYSELGIVQNKLIIAKDENINKFGVIDLDNKFVIKPEYEYISNRNDNYFIVGNEEFKEGIINNTGEIKVPFQYENLEIKYNDIVMGTKDKDVKYISLKKNKEGELDLRGDIINYNNNEIITQTETETRIYKLIGDN